MKRLTTEEFIKKAQKVHGRKYDYSKVKYINNSINVIIICKIHGEFLQTPANHLSKKGCKYCANNQNSTTKEFIKKSIKIHGYKYDYSKVSYINNHTPVIIICPIHGEFLQLPYNHIINKSGCPKCIDRTCLNKLKSSTKEFIKKSQKIHDINIYDYSKVDYKNAYTKVIIICPIDGEFLVTPTNHLRGKGCPICRSSKGELLIAKTLKMLNVFYVRQKRFDNLKIKRKLSYDFYLPEHNMLIEFNGEQHYRNLKHWHKNGKTLEDQQHRDTLKKQYTIDNGYKFLVIKYDEDIEKVLKTNIHPF